MYKLLTITSLLGLIFSAHLASAACYQANVGANAFDGFSAADAKLTILWGGMSTTSAIGISSETLGKRVNSDFNPSPTKLDPKIPTSVRCMMSAKGEFIATIDKGNITHIQPRGKFSSDRNMDDSASGKLIITGASDEKIELTKAPSDESCIKALYSRSPNSKASRATVAPSAADAKTATASERPE